MKKKSLILLVLSLVALVCFSLFACNKDTKKNEIKISPERSTVRLYEEIEFTYETNLVGDAEWTSSDMSIITFFDGGKARAIGVGTATVMVTVNNLSSNAIVTVIEDETQQEVSLNVNFASVSLHLNESVQLQAELNKGEEPINATISFDSKNEQVVIVNQQGELTPISLGKAEIEISCVYEGLSYSKTVFVEIIDNVVLSISKNNVNLISLTNGNPTQYKLDCFVYKNNEKVNSANIIWSVDDSEIATVDTNGLITVNKQGQTFVTAMWQDGGNKYYAAANIIVGYYEDFFDTKEYLEISNVSSDTAWLKIPKTLIEVDKIKEIEDTLGKKNVAILDVNTSENSVEIDKYALRTRGDYSLTFLTEKTRFSGKVVLCDQIITTADELNAYLDERITTSTTAPEIRTYTALGSNIKIHQMTQDNTQGNPTKFFYDTFDGAGYMLSPANAGNPIWTYGMFAKMEGATVKNLIIKDVLVARGGYSETGAIARQLGTDSLIENCVVINPIVTNAGIASGGEIAGVIVGSVWNDGATMRNCLVYDTQSLTNTQPVGGDKTGYENGVYSGKIILRGLFGKDRDWETSSHTKTITNNYIISANAWLAGVGNNAVSETTDLVPNALCNNFEEFLTKVDGDVSAFEMLQTGLDGTITCAGLTLHKGETISLNAEPIYVDMESTFVFDTNDYVELSDKTINSVGLGTQTLNYSSKGTEIEIASVDLKSAGVNGARNIIIATGGKNYSLNVILCDEIITTADELTAYLNERITASTTAPEYRTYTALGANIKIHEMTQDNNQGNPDKFFYDTFDGNGYMISPLNAGNPIWTYGIFAKMHGATVKNLILKDILVARNGYSETGAIARQLTNGSVIENCVVINPIVTNASASNGTQIAGVLVGSVWGEGTTIKDCLVYDAQSLTGTQPVGGDKTGYTNGVYSGALKLRGLFGKNRDWSLNSATITNNYVISANSWLAGVGNDATSETTDLISNAICDSYSAFLSKVNNDISAFTLLKNDGSGSVSCGGVVLFENKN